MSYNDLVQFTIAGGETICHVLCKTCAPNSQSGDPNACTSCYPGDNKVSEHRYDRIFKCSKEVCNVIKVKLKDGSYYCHSLKPSNSSKTVMSSSLKEHVASKNAMRSFSKFSEPLHQIPSSSNYTVLYTVFYVIIIITILFGIIMVINIGIGISVKKMSKKSNLRRIKISTNRPSVSLSENQQFEFIPLRHPVSPRNHSNLEVIMNVQDFQIGQCIGGGNYSKVYEGRLRGKPVAIKMALNKGKKSIYTELKIYEKITHPSIVEALGVHLGVEDMLFLRIKKCNLKVYFMNHGSHLNYYHLKRYCIQIVDGVKYLHNKNILHCDLKIDNILIKDESVKNVEISDFGCAIDLTNDREPSFNGTVTHTSFELLKKMLDPKYPAKPSKASDVWAYAITAWQIFQKSDQLPNGFLSAKEIVTNYEQGRKLPTPTFATEIFWRYIFFQCFDLDPQSRPTMQNLHKSLINYREDSDRYNIN